MGEWKEASNWAGPRRPTVPTGRCPSWARGARAGDLEGDWTPPSGGAPSRKSHQSEGRSPHCRGCGQCQDRGGQNWGLRGESGGQGSSGKDVGFQLGDVGGVGESRRRDPPPMFRMVFP